ncbi:ParA family protein [Corynebacterium uropygiale]|uniref:ParA family protein n=1 Tax=Corynebacterium uropygiale TaxID=1775911 RepID=A0A9X1QMR1_9CORY|nr:ParA family protein [Corynebacterium uropygiale]MCF4006144.1 ParA family protein [Corynebacterium uropygiale]
MTTTIALCNLKGGTGKTTTTIYLASALTAQGYSVRVLDLDPQGSATEWAEEAEANDQPLDFEVSPANKRTISKSYREDFVLIDCPPGGTDVIDTAISVADLVIVPTSPSAIETSRMWNTLAIAHAKTAYVLLTSVRFGTKEAEELLEVLRDERTPRIPTQIPLRQDIKRSWGMKPVAWHGYDDVAEFLTSEEATDE